MYTLIYCVIGITNTSIFQVMFPPWVKPFDYSTIDTCSCAWRVISNTSYFTKETEVFDYTILSSVTCMSILYRSVRFFMFLHCNTAMPCKHKNWISIYKEIYCPQNIDILRF